MFPAFLPTTTCRLRRTNLPRILQRYSFLWENLWVAGLRQAILEAGGQLVERAQIAPEVVEQFKQELGAE